MDVELIHRTRNIFHEYFVLKYYLIILSLAFTGSKFPNSILIKLQIAQKLLITFALVGIKLLCAIITARGQIGIDVGIDHRMVWCCFDILQCKMK